MRAIVLLALAATACNRDPFTENGIYDRAEMVRVCGNGWVARDPQTGRLAWGNGWTRTLIAEGMTADQVCDGKKEKPQ